MKKAILFWVIVLSVGGAWSMSNYLEYAHFLADKKVIVRQVPTENYRLWDRVLRQEIVGIVLRMTQLNFRDISRTDLPDPYTCENVFVDVHQDTPNTWVCRSAEIAAKSGIITTNNDHFRPQDPITRAEALAMIFAATKLLPDTTTDPWQDGIMKQALTLDVLPIQEADPDEFVTRWEVFYLISQVTKVLYKREIVYLESL